MFQQGQWGGQFAGFAMPSADGIGTQCQRAAQPLSGYGAHRSPQNDARLQWLVREIHKVAKHYRAARASGRGADAHRLYRRLQQLLRAFHKLSGGRELLPEQIHAVYNPRAFSGMYSGAYGVNRPVYWSVMSKAQKVAWLKGAIRELKAKQRKNFKASRAGKIVKYADILAKYTQKLADKAEAQALKDSYEVDPTIGSTR